MTEDSKSPNVMYGQTMQTCKLNTDEAAQHPCCLRNGWDESGCYCPLPLHCCKLSTKVLGGETPVNCSTRRIEFPSDSFSYTMHSAGRSLESRRATWPKLSCSWAVRTRIIYIYTGIHAACNRETTSRLTSCYMLNVLNVLSFWKTMDVTIEVNCYDNELNQRTIIWWT